MDDEPMTNFRSYLTAENLMLFAFMLLAEAAGVLFNVTATEPSAAYELLKNLGYLYALGYWVQVDSRRHSFRWPYCRGVFLQLIWMFLIPYYLFKTRGRKAFLTLLIFIAMYVFALLVAATAAMLLVAPRFD